MTNTIVSTNTTWLTGTTHDLTSTLQIASGVTLTIQPGVVVNGNGNQIQTFGSIDAEGTPGNLVQFNDVNFAQTNPSPPFQVTLNYVAINGGSFLAPSGYNATGSFSLTNSYVHDIPGFEITYPTSNVLIQGNYFSNIGGITTFTQVGGNVLIDHNTFSGWTGAGRSDPPALIINGASYGTSSTTISNNNFSYSGKVVLELPPGYTDAGMTSVGNYFGTSDLSLIPALIYDETVDLNSRGTISNTSIQTAAVSGVPTSPPCFAFGTRIQTEFGMRPVEHLRIGDQVTTVNGLRPIVWIGWRDLDCSRHSRPQDVMPVRITPNAFGEGLPATELVLSPDHAVYVNGMLIPIRYLLNGATITQQNVAKVSYWHVELQEHGLLFAEGLPCESYLDTGNRAGFANGGASITMHPEFARTVWQGSAYAPLASSGIAVTRVRQQLLDRAIILGFPRTDEPDLCLHANGEMLLPDREGNTFCFVVPQRTSTLVLFSRRTVPAFQQPTSNDYRELGVPVAALYIDGAAMPASDPRRGRGWYEAEPHWQWTNGEATIHCLDASIVEITIAFPSHYWADDKPKYECHANAA